LIGRFDDVIGGVARVPLDDLFRRGFVLQETLNSLRIAFEEVDNDLAVGF
jgi:hypothetical protein